MNNKNLIYSYCENTRIDIEKFGYDGSCQNVCYWYMALGKRCPCPENLISADENADGKH